MKTFSSLLMSTALAFLAGCAFSKDPGAKPAAPTAADVVEEMERKKEELYSKGIIKDEDIITSIFEGANANQYILKIQYPPSAKIRLKVAMDDVDLDISAPEMEIAVEGGASHNVSFKVYNALGDLILKSSRPIRVPRDLVISKGMGGLMGDFSGTFGRVYFEQEATLKTNGFNWSIESQKLYILPNANIMNFKLSESTSDEKRRGGGTITIRTNEAIGTLVVNLQGATGRNGADGTKVDDHYDFNTEEGIADYRLYEHMNGANGKDAISEKADCETDNYGRLFCRHKGSCTVPPGNGLNGNDGANGDNGDDGENGGNTGNLFVQVKNGKDFYVRLYAKPGTGGKGGKGDPIGYPGGLGGAPGVDVNEVCQKASRGTDGKQGGPGSDGKNGKDGNMGTFIFNGFQNVKINDVDIKDL